MHGQELKTAGSIMNALLSSSIIAVLILVFIIVKYDPFDMFGKSVDSASVEQMESWMTKSEYAVIHPAECNIINAVDGIMIFRTQQAPAEYIEFEDEVKAKECYNKVIDNLVTKYGYDECTKIVNNENTFNLKCDSSCYYIKCSGKYILYIWTTAGLFDEVSNLIKDIPF